MKKDEVALRKRAQIVKANRTMFFWVAGMSVIVGFSLVASYFLFQRMLFNHQVLDKKWSTVSTLKKNKEAVDTLQKNVMALNSNASLLALKASQDDEALQVILDALPAQANTLALGASIQDRLLSGLEVEVDSLTVEEGAEASVDTSSSGNTDQSSTDGDDSSTQAASELQALNFTLTVKGDMVALQTLLQRLERSIRTIAVQSLEVQQQGDTAQLVINATAYYQLAKEANLREESMKMGEKQ